MVFEFDPVKSAGNRTKHGIDFVEAQRLWEDPDLLEIQARTMDEARWLVVARLRDQQWAAVITRRGDTVRLIAVRRAREKEVAWHESQGL